MKHKKVVILGSTGSIGRNVLKVAAGFPEHFTVVGMTAGRNIDLLRQQIETFSPRVVSVAEEDAALKLKTLLGPGRQTEIVWGQKGNEQVACLTEADMVVSAIVGAAGLLPTFAAIRSGKDIALANKETLVMAGRLIMDEVKKKQVRLLPIDSEHSAIAQALEAGRKEDVARIILTASGGPFLHLAEENLWQVTPEKALDHPNWDMGRKISVDSATLMNKGLEVIEAHWLFDIALEKIEVLVHPQSIVHSLVEFIDGSVVAQLGIPDMRVPISYALSYPERLDTGLSRLNLTECSNLSFLKPDTNRFPALQIAYEACKTGGCMPTVLNAANEIAVAAFLEGKLKFPEISKVVRETLAHTKYMDDTDIETILDVDRLARIESAEVVRLMTKHAVRAD
ncbi:MAG: 1-deoxy-D-xylulose-5-phosphate reductoisomerase [Deltaproteobacteria bacterium]|jgi:1-deoxy-D-xylulose-5-phosphate reductoisomerase|nr:1-deoxy-D-xylulose-5-phosphate reductoisomerase [Deltaproteobacteria bacterium]